MTTLHTQTQDNPMTNSSQRMALSANKNKNWRANYLRALNIVTPDVTTCTRGRRGSSGEGPRRTTGQQQTTNGRVEMMAGRRRTATVTDEAMRRPPSGHSRRGRSGFSTTISTRQSSSRSGSLSRNKRGALPPDDLFGRRSHVFRTRRLASRSDLVMVDCTSAAIEIPTGLSVMSSTALPSRADQLSERDVATRRRHGSSSNYVQHSTGTKHPMVQLLSWEEPSVILGKGGWLVEVEPQNGRRTDMNVGFAMPRSSSRSTKLVHPNGMHKVWEETEDEDVDGLTNSEDEEDIFKMEVEPGNADSVLKTKRATPWTQRQDWKQLRLDRCEKSTRDPENDEVTPLSASFIPPHEMVEHGCFSLGLRDELKRKPGLVLN